uniref:Reverse transcriptase/retrotransposon-derived protein RNase H-like domain-containing protein n=1 Tax=Sinocyclocheilus rhinocerous TaxID=307959 RepID=A0A673NPS4_9TELE
MVALCSFLGLTSWFNKFLPNYATVVAPLRQMLRANAQTPLQWSKETVESFDMLKRMLLQSPVLAIYDPSLPTFISTDTSDYGLGAVLTPLHPDGVERVIAFASRTLSTSERKYSAVEKEALACVWAVEKWRTSQDTYVTMLCKMNAYVPSGTVSAVRRIMCCGDTNLVLKYNGL